MCAPPLEIKNRANQGLPRDLYFFRDEQGLEVDFLIIAEGGELELIEAKWSKTISTELARPLQKLQAAVKSRPVKAFIVHPAARTGPPPHSVAPGVKALDVETFLKR